MMAHDELISNEQDCSVPQLIAMYNDAVDLIWSLRDEIRGLEQELELYQQTVDELIDQMYG